MTQYLAFLNAAPNNTIFIYNAPNGGAVNEVASRQNLEQFVSAPQVAPPQPSSTPLGAPTLSEWGMILLAVGLVFVAALKLRIPSAARTE